MEKIITKELPLELPENLNKKTPVSVYKGLKLIETKMYDGPTGKKYWV